MAFWQKLVRCASLALLLSVGVDLLVVDLATPWLCDDGTTSTAGQTHSKESPSFPGDSDGRRDDCFCCCSHVVISNTVELVPLELLGFTFKPADPAEPATEPSLIYHPPRA